MPKMGEGYLPLLYIPDGAGRYAKLPVLTTTQRDALTGVKGMIIFNSTTDQLEEYDGATWEAAGQIAIDTHAALTATHGVSGTIADADDLTTHEADFDLHNKVVRKTADETVNNSDTLQDDDELLFAIGANEVWYIKVVLRVNSGTTPDIQAGITVPSGGVFQGQTVQETNSVGHISAGTGGGATTAGVDEIGIVIDGIVTNGATAGNVTVQWAQLTQDNSDTKVLANSCIIATQLL